MGGGIDLERCDPEIREAVFDVLRKQDAEARHEARLAKLRGRL